MGFTWIVPPDIAFPQLGDAYALAIVEGVRAIMARRRPQIEQWMKENGRWQDVTGETRRRLFAELDELASELTGLVFGHGVDHGMILELRHGGRYAIVGPALDHFAPIIWRDIQEFMRG